MTESRKIMFRAGNFELSTYTCSYPMWMTLTYQGFEFKNFRHDELKDLAHVIDRMKNQAREMMPEQYRFEFD